MMNDDQIVALYRGWDAFERAIGKDGVYVIDFDLAPGQYGDSFTNRWQILDRLIEYQGDLSEDDSQEAFLKMKLNSSIYYLRSIMGENIPFNEYIEQTMGICPHFISEDEITRLHEEIDQTVSTLWGFRYLDNYAGSFFNKFGLESFKNFQPEVEQNVSKWYERIKQYIDVPPLPQVYMHFVNKNEFWHSWISGYAPEGITLEINKNPDLKYQFIKSEPARLATHEICGHVIHMSCIQQGIEEGILRPANGLVLVHSSEMIQAEGIGQILPEIISNLEEEFNELFIVARKIYTHRFMVLNNAFLRLTQGEPIRKVYEYSTENLPFYSGLYIEKELRLWNSDSSMKSYRYIHSISENFFRNIIKQLTKEQKLEFLKNMYFTPMTPAQIKNVVNQKYELHVEP